jgi:crossover junction endodeoxyribonuclease RuvC
MRILGIDPGSRHTGYGVVDVVSDGAVQAGCVYVTSGVITPGTLVCTLPERLQSIFQGLSQVIEIYAPAVIAIESVFVGVVNPASALKLGQARGAAIVAAVSRGITVFEYTAKQVKLSVCGYGGAQKQQMQKMVQQLLKIDVLPKVDAADALAVAMCHCYSVKGYRVGVGDVMAPRRRIARKSRWRLESEV